MFPTTASPWLQDASPLKTLIARATYPSQPEPNYALNLEVAEYINQKKANTPREAAMTIAHLVNHRNPHVAMLALALLDTLTQNCGYPFHLQIATKEFLNELVRRFPERPPPYPGPVMSRILELIHGWKEGICVESRFKDDLGNIRDMHRLLTFKGYRFRDVPRRAANVEGANLKTAEELENEDREAQSAKLQELIRRGTPRDLAQAQELMKALAGANPDAKPDYRSQALTELNKLESKVILLNEMLDNVDVQNGERFAQGDVYDQVASILKNARPKIQGWISNAETDDPESLDTFLQINDQINTVLNRYEAFKRGDYAAAANPVPSELSSSSKPGGDLSLIDFDDSDPNANAANGQQASTGGIDELASLFGSGPSSNAAPAVQQPIQQQPVNPNPNANLFAQLSGSNFSSTSASPNIWSPQPGSQQVPMGAHPGASSSPARPPYGQANSFSNPSMMAGLAPSNTPPPGHGALRLGSPGPAYAAAARPGSGMGMVPQQPVQLSQPWMAQQTQPIQPQVQPAYLQQTHQQPQQQPQQPQAQTQQGKDPFADLAGLF